LKAIIVSALYVEKDQPDAGNTEQSNREVADPISKPPPENAEKRRT
jgi:hypothetical protein